MFGTIGHTFELMKMSWRVLMLDRELIFFPVMSAVGMVLLAGAVFAGGLLGGAFGLAEEGGEGSGGDLALDWKENGHVHMAGPASLVCTGTLAPELVT